MLCSYLPPDGAAVVTLLIQADLLVVSLNVASFKRWPTSLERGSCSSAEVVTPWARCSGHVPPGLTRDTGRLRHRPGKPLAEESRSGLLRPRVLNAPHFDFDLY